MAFIDSIKEARKRGADDDAILSEIIKQNPNFASSTAEATKRGANSTMILGEIIRQNAPQKNEAGIIAKAGQGIANISGLGGMSKAVAGAGAVLQSQDVLNQAGKAGDKATEIIKQARALPQGSPERKQLLEEAKRITDIESERVGSLEKDLEQAPTPAQAAGSTAKTALNVGTFGTSGLAARVGLKGTLGLLSRSAEAGLTGATFQALDNIESGKPVGENVGTVGAIAASIPVVGTALSKAKGLVGKAGQKIQYSVIKPSTDDIEDGFKIETLKKYGLGGSLGDTYTKTQQKLSELSEELIKSVKNKNTTINLNDIYEQTIKDLSGGKARNFGNLGSTKRVLENLGSEIETVSSNGLVDLVEGQAIKQAAGQKGSWVFGSADPDATAVERVYTTFYRKLKKAIEQQVPEVQGINSQISELIPVINAVTRRIPIAERNNILSLTDVINMGLTAVDPRAAGLLIVNKLSKSGRVGELLSRFESKPATTNIGKRIFTPASR